MIRRDKKFRGNSTRFRHEKNNFPESASPSVPLLKIFAAVISFLVASLTLWGYGVAFARAVRFRFEVIDVYRSPIDFLSLSADVVLSPFGNADISRDALIADFPKLIFLGCIFAALFVCIAALCSAFVMPHPNREKYRVKVSKAKTTALEKVKASRKGILYLSAVALGLVLPLLASWIQLHFARTILALIAIFPIIGYQVENKLITENIISPKYCYSVTHKDGAICLAIKEKSGVEIARGRRIVKTQDSILLYIKESQTVIHVPTRDAIIEEVESDRR